MPNKHFFCKIETAQAQGAMTRGTQDGMSMLLAAPPRAGQATAAAAFLITYVEALSWFSGQNVDYGGDDDDDHSMGLLWNSFRCMWDVIGIL